MPDKWGRPEFNDFWSITQGLRNIQDIGHKSKLFDQGQEDRTENKLLKKDANYNASLFRPGAVQIDEGSPYASDEEAREAAMRGTSDARLLGRQIAAKEAEAQRLLKNDADTNEYEKSLGGLVTWRQQNPGVDWEKAPLGLYAGVNGQKAYVEAIRMGAETAEGKQRTQDAIYKAASQRYPVFMQQKQMIQESLHAGNIDMAANIAREMSKQLPIPYQLGGFDKATQSFDVQYLDSNTGKFQSTGKIQLTEVVGKINQTGEREYVTGMTLHAMAVDKGNREKRMNPMFGKNSNGDRFLIIPQKQWANPNQVEIEVRNEKTNEKTMFPSWEALQSFGITPENMGREKSLKELDVKDAAIASHNRANRPGTKWANMDLYDKNGNKVTAKSKIQYNFYKKKGYTEDNPDTGAKGKYDITMKQIDSVLSKYKGKVDGDGYEISPEAYLEQTAKAPNAPKSIIADWTKFAGLKRNADEFYQGATGGMVGGNPADKVGGVDLSAFDKGGVPETAEAYAPPKQANENKPNVVQSSFGRKQTPPPSITKDGGFKASMDSLVKNSGGYASEPVKTALKITNGNFNPKDNTIIFKPSNEADLKQILQSLNKAGVYFDAKEGPDGQIIVSVIEDNNLVSVNS